ncbi:MAG: hypothetical protein MUC96_14850 [Myxococcaceae bacterium]|jgi:hypothetical protein|nr:hypothetical protein [Myxococcaceae bacterium]
MLGLALAGWLSAAPTAARADALAAKGEWEELYLAFAAAAPDGFSAKDQARVARALTKGCEALLPSDAVMAFSLGEKAVAFQSTPLAVVCTARAAIRTDQRSAAEEALRLGLKRHPKDGDVSLELGRLLVGERDGAGALTVLAQVPKTSKAFAEAQRLAREAEALAREDADARAVLAGGGRTPQAPPPRPSEERPAVPADEDEPAEDQPGARRPPPSLGTSRSYESGVDDEGRRIRFNAFFRFRYFSARRDFGQRADYEGQVQDALESSRLFAQRVMGVSRETPVDVILYSKAEFTLHHGPWAAAAIAGFYSQSAIRMNDSAEINERNRAVLVHEYVHAVIDELANFNDRGVPRWVHEGLAEYVEWQFEGRSRPEGRYDSYLRQLATQGRLPRLSSMRDDPLIASQDPGTLYAFAAIAIGTYIERWGMPDLLRLIRDIGRGVPFEKAFAQHTGTELSSFEESIADVIRAR